MKQQKFILFRGETIPLTLGDDGLWRTPDLTVWAMEDFKASSADVIDRCGIGVFSLGEDHPLTAACAAHDYMYSSRAFQLFHTRKEADEMLEQLVDKAGRGHWYRYLAKPFKWLSRIFGAKYWENERTR
jgi:hypothetical protein